MPRVNKIAVGVLFVLLPLVTYAQRDELAVRLNKRQLQPGDTLIISALYTINDTTPPAGTLFLNLVNENNSSWQMRWPLVDGKCMTALILPANIARGSYRLFFSAMQAVFTIQGKVKKPSGISSLKTLFLTTNGAFKQVIIPVGDNGSFAYANNMFPDAASIYFSRNDGGDNDVLDIRINTVLDAVFLPAAKMVRETVSVGVADSLAVEGIAVDDDTVFLSRTKALPVVTVFGQRLRPIELFEQLYTHGLFKSTSARIIDLLDDPAEANGQTVYFYLQNRVAGIRFGFKKVNGQDVPIALWRGDEVGFYLDETPVELDLFRGINTRNVAMIKMFSPPFFGGRLGGSGGAVVVYTKRGNLLGETANKTAFRVKGYSPLVVPLPAEPE